MKNGRIKKSRLSERENERAIFARVVVLRVIGQPHIHLLKLIRINLKKLNHLTHINDDDMRHFLHDVDIEEALFLFVSCLLRSSSTQDASSRIGTQELP